MSETNREKLIEKLELINKGLLALRQYEDIIPKDEMERVKKNKLDTMSELNRVSVEERKTNKY